MLSSLTYGQYHPNNRLARMDSTAKAEFWLNHMNKIDSLAQIDYLAYNYRYLDKDFSIHMDSITFHKAMEKYSFITHRITRYQDSLGVVLMLEFDDWDQSRIAQLSITYSWQRIGYYTWQSPQNAQAFAAQFRITHPYRMRELLIDEDYRDRRIMKFYRQLRHKVAKETGREDLDTFSREDFLKVAWRSNPERIADFKKFQEERRKQRATYRKKQGAKENEAL